MKQYLDLLRKVKEEGVLRPNRTGTDAYGIFGEQLKFDLQDGFPMVTTKKVHFPSVAHELIWFIRGDTNIKYLHDNKVTIWDEWADKNGDLGPVYGKQWRRWGAGNLPAQAQAVKPSFTATGPGSKLKEAGMTSFAARRDVQEEGVRFKIAEPPKSSSPPAAEHSRKRGLLSFFLGDRRSEQEGEQGISRETHNSAQNSAQGGAHSGVAAAPGEYDQLAAVVKGLKEDPFSRRHIVNAWNVGELSQMALPPCHVLFQFFVETTEASADPAATDHRPAESHGADPAARSQQNTESHGANPAATDHRPAESHGANPAATARSQQNTESHGAHSAATAHRPADSHGANPAATARSHHPTESHGANPAATDHRPAESHGANPAAADASAGTRPPTSDPSKLSLSCHLYQRSADVFIGVPFNIASYALLTCLLAHVSGMKPGKFIHSFGDVHLYDNHIAQATEQLSREPFPLPQLRINPELTDIFKVTYADITLENYKHHQRLPAQVAV